MRPAAVPRRPRQGLDEVGKCDDASHIGRALLLLELLQRRFPRPPCPRFLAVRAASTHARPGLPRPRPRMISRNRGNRGCPRLITFVHESVRRPWSGRPPRCGPPSPWSLASLRLKAHGTRLRPCSGRQAPNRRRGTASGNALVGRGQKTMSKRNARVDDGPAA